MWRFYVYAEKWTKFYVFCGCGRGVVEGKFIVRKGHWEGSDAEFIE
jgi:hypothetical protein